MTPLLRCDPRMGATTVSSMDGHIWRWAGNIPTGLEPEFEPRLAHYSKCYTYTWFGSALQKTYACGRPPGAKGRRCSGGQEGGLPGPRRIAALPFYPLADDPHWPLSTYLRYHMYARARPHNNVAVPERSVMVCATMLLVEAATRGEVRAAGRKRY